MKLADLKSMAKNGLSAQFKLVHGEHYILQLIERLEGLSDALLQVYYDVSRSDMRAQSRIDKALLKFGPDVELK